MPAGRLTARPRARVAALLAAALAVAGAGIGVAASASSSCSAQRSVHHSTFGAWTEYALPRFGSGPQRITAHAVDATNPLRWYATNGVEVFASSTGGCSWKSFYTLPAQPSPSAPYSRDSDRITQLRVPAAQSGGGELFATVRGLTSNDSSPVALPTGPQHATFVLNGTETLHPSGPLAFPLGDPGPMAIAESDPRVLYVAVGNVVNVSTDKGQTWTPRPATAPLKQDAEGQPVLPGQAPPPVRELGVDPGDPASVFATVGSDLLHSSDSGASWSLAATASRDTSVLVGLDVMRYTPTTVAVRVAEQKSLYDPVFRELLSLDGGASFRALAAGPRTRVGVVDGSPTWTGHGTQREFVVATSDRDRASAFPQVGVYVQLDDSPWVRVDKGAELPPLAEVQVDKGARSTYYFRSADRLVRFGAEVPLAELPNGTTETPGKLPGFVKGLPPLSSESVISPGATDVLVKPGRSVTRHFDVDLGPEPTPIDVFFLLDTSQSMEDVAQALAKAFKEVADDLSLRRIDVNIGLGEYQSWDETGVRYRLLADIAPPGDEFRDRLQELQTQGGKESMDTALDQVATGEGIPNPSVGSPVAPGQDPTWRPGTLRVVVNASDQDPDLDGRDRDGPTFAEMIRHLAAKRIHHVGFQVKRQVSVADPGDPVLNPNAGSLAQRMQKISAGTGTFAPAPGVDCDGNGTIDLATGAPLVCPLYTNQLPSGETGAPDTRLGDIRISSPLVALLGTIHDVQAADLAVFGQDPVAADVAPDGDYTRLDVKRSHHLGFSVTFRCQPSGSGDDVTSTHELQLSPKVGLRVGAPALARVTCEYPPPPPPVIPPQQQPVVVPLPPVVPQPAPAQPVQPLPVQNPAQAAQPGNVLQPGVNEEEQAQLALAAGDLDDEDDTEPGLELAMSLLSLTVVSAGFGGLVLRHRGKSSSAEQLALARAALD